MNASDILASIEALRPTAREGWAELIADLRAWGVNEAKATTVRVAEDTIVLDRPSTTPGRSIMCRFKRDADARRALQLLKGYQAALKAGA